MNYHNNTLDRLKDDINDQIKKNPSLINNNLFIIKNIAYLDKKLEDFSTQLTNNELFLYNYFAKCEASKSDYKYITHSLLDNPIFIGVALEKNPDIYLLLKEEQKKDEYFKVLENYHSEKLLKYVSKEKLNDVDYCYKIIQKNIENYEFTSDASKIEDRVLRTVFANIKRYNEDYEVLRYIKFLPKEKKEDVEFNKYLLEDIEINLFPYISSIHRENVELCKSVIAKKPHLFKNISNNLKNDKNFVETLLNDTKYEVDHSSWPFPNMRIKSTQLKSTQTIIPLLPLQYFTKEFCEEFKEDLSQCFTELPSSHRKELHIIKAALSGFQDEEKLDYQFETLIGIKEIRHAIKDYTRTESRGTHVYAFLSSYLLTSELEKSLGDTKTTPKMKI